MKFLPLLLLTSTLSIPTSNPSFLQQREQDQEKNIPTQLNTLYISYIDRILGGVYSILYGSENSVKIIDALNECLEGNSELNLYIKSPKILGDFAEMLAICNSPEDKIRAILNDLLEGVSAIVPECLPMNMEIVKDSREIAEGIRRGEYEVPEGEVVEESVNEVKGNVEEGDFKGAEILAQKAMDSTLEKLSKLEEQQMSSFKSLEQLIEKEIGSHPEAFIYAIQNYEPLVSSSPQILSKVEENIKQILQNTIPILPSDIEEQLSESKLTQMSSNNLNQVIEMINQVLAAMRPVLGSLCGEFVPLWRATNSLVGPSVEIYGDIVSGTVASGGNGERFVDKEEA